MRMDIFVCLFMIVWLSGVSAIAAAMINIQISRGSFEPGSLIILPFYVFGYGLSMGAFKEESIKSKKFFAELFEGKETN
ncbi:MAG: hypothetical protein J7604_02500 [Sporocytophaga sp.]|uniref:hypothetical protein n=1 Tax=Sporocytophaga sp. TaxID=2231183 RepID=UPI001B03D9EC|nr:hypothetical protein [Sporocytophaga sp.]MBO9699048.1 hypothetical protein [Sporocytophaga sp.]